MLAGFLYARGGSTEINLSPISFKISLYRLSFDRTHALLTCSEMESPDSLPDCLLVCALFASIASPMYFL